MRRHWSYHRSGSIMAALCVVLGGFLVWDLQDCLRRGVIAGVIILSLFLLVLIGTFVLSLAAIISDRYLDEVIEDLVRWWRKKGANAARGLARRLLYLLGSAACGGVVYLCYLIERWTRLQLQPLWWAYLLGALVTAFACLTAMGGFFLLLLAITGRPLKEIWVEKKRRKEE